MLTFRAVHARALLVAALATIVAPAGLNAQAPAGQSAQPAERTVWYFYKVKWGFQDEFVDLFRRNHLPLLRAQVGTRLVAVKTYVPTYHGDGRGDWTFAVVIVYKDTATMTGPSPEAELAKKTYPDQERFRKEEQRRFEILEAHWDVPLNELNLATPPGLR